MSLLKGGTKREVRKLMGTKVEEIV